MSEEKELQQSSGLPALNINVGEISHHIERWENAKQVISRGGGKTIIQGQPYINKKGWRLVALATGLSLEIVEPPKRIEAEDEEGKYYTWIFHVRATAPNGRYAEAWGACSSRDTFFSVKDGKRRKSSEIDESDIIHTAQTCAFNRAISDLVGGGEVSAEEIKVNLEQNPKATTRQINYLKRLLMEAGICSADIPKEENRENANRWLVERGFNTIDELNKNEAIDVIKTLSEYIQGGEFVE